MKEPAPPVTPTQPESFEWDVTAGDGVGNDSAESLTSDPSEAVPIGEPPASVEFESIELSVPTAEESEMLAEGLSAAAEAPTEVFWKRMALWSAAGGVGLFVAGGLIGAYLFRDVPVDGPLVAPVESASAFAEEPGVASEEIDATGVTMESASGEGVSVAPILAEQEILGSTKEAAADPTADVISSDPESSPAGNAETLEAETFVAAKPIIEPVQPAAENSGIDPEPEAHSAVGQLPEAIDLLSFDPRHLDLAFEGVGEMPVRPSLAEAPRTEASAEPTDIQDGLKVTAPVRRGPETQLDQARLTVQERLALTLENVAFRDVALADWLDTMSSLTDVPITLAPQALMMISQPASTAMSVSGTNTTCEALLRKGLASKRLVISEEGGQLVVRKLGFDRQREVRLPVDDLAASTRSGDSLPEELLRTFVAPHSWNESGVVMEQEGGALRIVQSNPVQFRCLIFTERMRLARGLRLRSNYPASRVSATPVYSQVLPKLGEPATVTFLPWVPLSEIVEYFERSIGMTVLVDWQHLQDLSLHPRTRLAVSIQDKTWWAALDELLAPLDLTWLALDAETLQITTAAHAAGHPQVEFYPLVRNQIAQYAEAGELESAARRQLRVRVDEPTSSAAEIRFDAASRHLIVRTSPAGHRAIEAWRE